MPSTPARRRAGTLLLLLSVLLSCAGKLHAQASRVATRAADSANLRLDTDSTQVAGSQPLELTFRLGPSPDQAAVLHQLLEAQATSGNPAYHHWLTPAEFAQQFSWSADVRQSLIDWLANQGILLLPNSSTSSRLVFQTTVSAANTAFHVDLRQAAGADGKLTFANNTEATLPEAFAAHIVSLAGLDNLPEPQAGRLLSATSRAAVTPSRTTSDLLASLEDAVQANTSPVLTLASTLCTQQTSTAERNAFHLALQQAQAQGITVLVEGSCAVAASDLYPSALSEVVAVANPSNNPVPTSSTDAAATTLVVGSELRPAWQTASGLPADGLRAAPDFAVGSLSALQSTVLTLVQQTGNRIGNLSPTLYALASAPDLFSHGDLAAATPRESSVSAKAATEAESSEDATPSSPATAPTSDPSSTSGQQWTDRSGLGLLNLQALLKLYPRATTGTSTALVSSSYSVGYGQGFTLTATVTPSAAGTTNPTGTVTFSSSGQGILGTAAVNSAGVATLSPSVLPAGTYNVTATYAGDTSYSGSASTSNVVITVSMVNATLTATIAPASKVPYGATATVTATVTLPNANATPTGVVSAQVMGVTGALYTATLSPNPGVNSATANIVVTAPPAGGYTVQITCQGNTNFLCQTPVNLTLGTVKGYSSTSVSVFPLAPQAGEPTTLTATVANGGNGIGSYSFSGSVSFYDGSKLLSTVALASNQATTTVAFSGNATHNITAIYSGDSNWNTSTSSAVAVNPTILADTLTLSSNATNGVSLAGVNLIFTATATTQTTYGVGPTGTVTFYDTFAGSVIALGSPSVLVPNGANAGIATFNTTGLQPGTHSIYAVYSGDSTYGTATSPVLQVTLSSFGITITPSSLVLDQGKSQQLTVLATSSGGYNGTISLGCVPPPSIEATCSFAPSSVTGGNSTTLTITTTAPTVARLHDGSSKPGLWSAASGASLALLAAWFLPRRSRRLPVLLAMLLATMASVSTLGCGMGVLSKTSVNNALNSSNGTSGGTTTDSGTPLGTQNFTLTAVASDGTNTVRHTYQYQVTVQ